MGNFLIKRHLNSLFFHYFPGDNSGGGGGGTMTRGGGGGGGDGVNIFGKKKKGRKALIQEIESELVENAKEANRQRQCMERTSENLEHRLRVIKTETERVNRTRLNENSHLIFECNDLRRELKNIQRKLDVSNQQCMELKRTNKKLMTNQATTQPPIWESSKMPSGNNSPHGNDQSKILSFMDVVEDIRGGLEKDKSDDEKVPEDGHGEIGQSLSAIELSAYDNSKAEPSTKSLKKAVQMQSAPAIFDDLSSRSRCTSARGKNENTRPRGGASPIPDTAGLRDSMTVEQRMLRKKDAQIQRLVDEANALTSQLDESNREKAMQRTELSRLRGIIANVIQTAPPLSGTKLPKRGKPNERVLLSVGMNNTTRVSNSLTHADFTGYPSDDDLAHMSASGSTVKPPAGGPVNDDDSTAGGKMRPVKVPIGAGYDARKKK